MAFLNRFRDVSPDGEPKELFPGGSDGSSGQEVPGSLTTLEVDVKPVKFKDIVRLAISTFRQEYATRTADPVPADDQPDSSVGMRRIGDGSAFGVKLYRKDPDHYYRRSADASQNAAEGEKQ